MEICYSDRRRNIILNGIYCTVYHDIYAEQAAGFFEPDHEKVEGIDLWT